MAYQHNANLHLPPSDHSLGAEADKWSFWPVAGAFGLAWLAFCWPWLRGHVTIPWDAKAHFAPQVQFMAQSFARGELPWWNPFVFSGHPQIADPQSMIFSPPMLVLALLNPSPSLWAIDVTALAMLLVAGLGVLILARDCGWHWAGALVAAIAFAFGAAMAWRLQHFGQVFSLAYFPIALLLLRRALAHRSLWYGALAGLIGAVMVLGRDQVALISVYMLVGFVAWYWSSMRWQTAAIVQTLPALVVCAVVGAATVALPILMTAELAAASNRPFIDYQGAGAGSLHPALLVTAAIPHVFGSAGEMANFWGPPSFTWEGTGLFIAQNMGVIYVGAVSFWLIAIAVLRGYVFEPGFVRFVGVAFVLVLLYALGWYTPVFRVYYELLPGVDLYRRPADAVFVIGGLGGLLAGYAASRLMQQPQAGPDRAQLIALLVMVLCPFVLAAAFAIAFDRLASALPALIMAVFWFAASGAAIMAATWLQPIRPLVAGLLLVVPLGLDLSVNNGPNGASALPAKALAMLETNAPNPTIETLKSAIAARSDAVHRPRVELVGLGFHWPNASLSHRLEHTLGYNPVRLKIYSEALGAGDTVAVPEQRKFTPLFASYNSLLAKMLGLRLIASGVEIETIDKHLKPGRLRFLARTDDAFIYDNPDTLPRVMFARRARRADFADIIKTGIWPGGFDATTTVLLEADVPLGVAGAAGRVRFVAYTNNEIVIECLSKDGGWVVLNDIWHPWWRATVNGVEQPIRRANVLFRAVRVGAGRQTVRFRFRPIRAVVDRLFN